MFPKRLRFLVGLALAAVVFPTFLPADERAATAEKTKIEPADAIRQALAKKIDWSFHESPLVDVIEYLRDEQKIPIGLDTKAIDDLGIAVETPVSFKMSGISAKTALKRMLADLGLAFTLDDEVLVITSPDAADCNLMTVFYNVADLPAFRCPDGKTSPHFEKLIELVTTTVKPTTWDGVGGPGSIVDYDAGGVQVLVVSQTWEVHDEISSLLDNLREFRQWPLSKEEIEKLPPLPPSKPKPPLGMMGGFGPTGYPMPPACVPDTVAPPHANPPASPPAAESPPPSQGMGMF